MTTLRVARGIETPERETALAYGYLALPVAYSSLA